MSFNKTLVTSFNMKLTYWKLGKIDINRIQETITATFFGYDSLESAHNKDIDEADRVKVFVRRDDFNSKFSVDLMNLEGNNLYLMLYNYAKETKPEFMDAEAV